jgi:hypothetical protein
VLDDLHRVFLVLSFSEERSSASQSPECDVFFNISQQALSTNLFRLFGNNFLFFIKQNIPVYFIGLLKHG